MTRADHLSILIKRSVWEYYSTFTFNCTHGTRILSSILDSPIPKLHFRTCFIRVGLRNQESVCLYFIRHTYRGHFRGAPFLGFCCKIGRTLPKNTGITVKRTGWSARRTQLRWDATLLAPDTDLWFQAIIVGVSGAGSMLTRSHFRLQIKYRKRGRQPDHCCNGPVRCNYTGTNDFPVLIINSCTSLELLEHCSAKMDCT